MLNSNENRFKQKGHSNAFSPVWTSICLLSLDFSKNFYLQIEHLYPLSE